MQFRSTTIDDKLLLIEKRENGYFIVKFDNHEIYDGNDFEKARMAWEHHQRWEESDLWCTGSSGPSN